MGTSRQTLAIILLGLCVAGCRSKPGTAVAIDDTPPAIPAAKPSLSPDPEAQNNRVVVESVNDTVDRFDQIIRQRAQANRDAADVREARRAVEPKATADVTPADEASAIEKLAAAVRAHQPIDPVPVHAPAKPQTPDEPASGALSSDTGVQINRPAATTVAAEPTPTIAQNSGEPMAALLGRYAERVAHDPRDLSAQLDLQIVHFLRSEPVPAMGDLAALPAEDRELLAALCDGLSNFRNVIQNERNPLASEKARPFVDMAERIQNRADLTLNGLTLCDKVTAFGVYENIEPLMFSAGAPRRCVLYTEVDGFLSQLNAAQRWETKLSLELRLYDTRGLQVWNVAPDVTTDSSKRRRRDFFLAKLIELPANLPAGQYMLKASVRDLQASRIAQQTIQFTVSPKVALGDLGFNSILKDSVNR